MALDDNPLVFCPGETGRELAKQIGSEFGWDFVDSLPSDGSPVNTFTEDLRSAFSAGRGIVCVCAAGIIIRALAPVIRDKHSEPPVVCVAPSADSVVPLLGGHHGANQLAWLIADRLNARPALTTASDALLGFSLDEPPPGWRLEDPQHVKSVTAAILAGQPTTVTGSHDSELLGPFMGLDNVSVRLSFGDKERVRIKARDAPPVHYSKQNLALGVGCVRNCTSKALRGLVKSSLSKAKLSTFAVEGIYSIDLKSNEAAVHDLADHLGVTARFYSPQYLETFTDRLTSPSETVFRETGTHGVSEAAALAAAGPDGGLVIPKQTAEGATCAVAKFGPVPGGRGTPRGVLMIIGIGPGGADWRTTEAQRMLGMADDIVGYSGYVGLLGAAATGKETHQFELGEETERCRFALELAGRGRRVALISSGDAGIYAMASLVFELLDSGPEQGGVSVEAQRAEILCAPGVSAMQMASARAGALLGHDFCAISLSDLLTPREDILKRVDAAASGDFVTAFYNPVSRRRRTLLKEARDLLLRHRAPGTPVLIAKNLGRPGEKLTWVPLSRLQHRLADMLTVVIVGNSQTRSFASGDRRAGAGGTFIYTPRGYADRERHSK